MSADISHLVIIAGGLGTRLRSEISDLPKVLTPIGGAPVLEHQLQFAAANGVKAVTIFAGYQAQQIHEYVKARVQDLRIDILVEEKPLGTAGAVLDQLDRLPEQFFLIYGDLVLSVDLASLARYHHEQQAALTMMLHPNDHPFDSDLVEVDEYSRVQEIHLCPHDVGQPLNNNVNAALHVVDRSSLVLLRENISSDEQGKTDFMRDVLPALLEAECKVMGYRTSQYLKDMGTSERLQDVERDYELNKFAPMAWRIERPAVLLNVAAICEIVRGACQLTENAPQLVSSLRQAGYLVVLIGDSELSQKQEVELEWLLGHEKVFVDGLYSGHKTIPQQIDLATTEHRLDLKNSWLAMDCDYEFPGSLCTSFRASDLIVEILEAA